MTQSQEGKKLNQILAWAAFGFPRPRCPGALSPSRNASRGATTSGRPAQPHPGAATSPLPLSPPRDRGDLAAASLRAAAPLGEGHAHRPPLRTSGSSESVSPGASDPSNVLVRPRRGSRSRTAAAGQRQPLLGRSCPPRLAHLCSILPLDSEKTTIFTEQSPWLKLPLVYFLPLKK